MLNSATEKPKAMVMRPKKPICAFKYYVKEKSTKKCNQNVAKCAKMWKALSDEEKKPYFDLAADDEKRFKDQKAEIE